MSTDWRTVPGPFDCVQCDARFVGSRHDACVAGWEPWSTRTQATWDTGPMVCRACIVRIITDCQAAMLAAAKAGRF